MSQTDLDSDARPPRRASVRLPRCNVADGPRPGIGHIATAALRPTRDGGKINSAIRLSNGPPLTRTVQPPAGGTFPHTSHVERIEITGAGVNFPVPKACFGCKYNRLKGEGLVFSLQCAKLVTVIDERWEGKEMKAYIIVFLALLVPAAAAVFDPVGIGVFWGAIAKVFFLIVPVVFIVGSAIGLVSRYRA